MTDLSSAATGFASLPNGEAVRPGEVRRVRIEPAVAPPRVEGQRFKVVLELVDGERLTVATGLTRADAQDVARRCTRALSEAARGPS